MPNYTKEEQFELIRGYYFGWRNLKNIDNPYEEVCLEAIKRDGRAIEYIKNPTEKMKLEAVKNNGDAIQYIKNPTDEMKLEAVKNNGLALKYIKNPTEEIKLEAIKKYGVSIQYIKNPTEEMKLEAIKQNGISIRYIENPTEEMKLEAVKSNGWSIEVIKNPTEEMKLEAIKNNGTAIRYIENPSEEMKLEAIKKNGWAIECIEGVSSEMCFYALLYMLRSYLNIKFDYEKLKISNVMFFVTDNDMDEYIDVCCEDGIVKELYFRDEDLNIVTDDPIFMMSLDIFNKVKKYLLDFNTGNHFIFDYSMDMETIKKVSFSNNSFIYLKYNKKDKMHSLCRTLANRVITIDDLLVE